MLLVFNFMKQLQKSEIRSSWTCCGDNADDGGGGVGGGCNRYGGCDGDGVSGLRTNSHLTNPGVCWLEDSFV